MRGWLLDTLRAQWRVLRTFVRQWFCSHPLDQWQTEIDAAGGVIQCKRCGMIVDVYSLDESP